MEALVLQYSVTNVMREWVIEGGGGVDRVLLDTQNNYFNKCVSYYILLTLTFGIMHYSGSLLHPTDLKYRFRGFILYV